MSGRTKIGASAVVAAAIGATIGLISTSTPEATAHGSTQVPASRVYSCRFVQPANQMCAAASNADPQAIYDWMEVNIGDADGRHQQLIPDGELCSAGRDKYAAFDEPGNWPLTHLTPNQAGRHEIVFENTAPHATAYYRIYLTRPGFDARSDRLAWGDLEQVHDSGPRAAESESRFSVSLPDRDVPAILYIVWQRSDSPEAFYACSDVTIGGNGNPPPGDGATTTTTQQPPAPTTTTAPATSTTTEPATDEPADGPPPPAAEDEGEPSSSTPGLTVSASHTAMWDTGRCSTIAIHNPTGSPVTWEVHYEPGGAIDSLWNAEVSDGNTFTGEDWTAEVGAGSTASFGMCVSYR